MPGTPLRRPPGSGWRPAAIGALVALLVLAPGATVTAAAPPAAADDTSVPDGPGSVTAIARHGEAVVRWEEPVNDGELPLQSYTVTASPGGARVEVTAPTTEAVVTGLSDGTAYTFAVTATNEKGTGQPSAPTGAVTPTTTAPDPPTDVTASAAGGGIIEVSWSAPEYAGGAPVTGYRLAVEPGGRIVDTPATTTSATVAGLAARTQYTFTVQSVNQVGRGEPSPATEPLAPEFGLTPRARVLSDGASDALTEVTETSLTFADAPADVRALRPDDVAVIAEASAAPDGLVRKVLGVTVDGADTVVSTSDADLSEAFSDGGLSLLTALRGNGDDPSAQGNPRVTVEVPVTETLAPGLEVRGKLGLDLSWTFKGKLLPPKLEITEEDTYKAELSLALTRKYEVFKKDKRLREYNLVKKIPIGPLKKLKVKFNVRIYVYVDVRAEAGFVATASTEQKMVTRVAGLTEGILGTVNEKRPPTGTGGFPSGPVKGTAEVGMRVDLVPRAVGQDLFKLQLYSFANIEADPLGNTLGKIQSCFKAGFELYKVWGLPTLKKDELGRVCMTVVEVQRTKFPAVDYAYKQLGKPYQYGASGPNAFDASGLTMAAWTAAGVRLPRTTQTQYAATSRISRANLRPGDLIFIRNDDGEMSHVALYIRPGRMIEAKQTGTRVRMSAIDFAHVAGYGRPVRS